MKIGRNDLCPCGSGKKYKKCCLEKDEQNLSANVHYMKNPSRFEPEIDEWEFEEEKIVDDDLDIFSEIFDEDDFDELSEDDVNEEIPQMIIEPEPEDGDEFPELSEEDNQLIEDWWEEYKMMNNTAIEREHLLTFMEQYPQLVDYLGLEYEVLFDLGAAHFCEGIYDTFVELLLRIRNEYPNTYRKSYGWYDYDLICWTVSQGRLDDIHPYFDFFKQDETSENTDKLVDLISFLRATNHSDILLTELKNTPCSKYLKDVIANDAIIQYMDKFVFNKPVNSLIDEILSIGFIIKVKNDTEYWKNKLSAYKRPFTQWDVHLPMKRSEALNYYLKITNNFTYFLYQKTGLTFDSAEYYADTIFQYYLKIVSNMKRPLNVFCLDMKSFMNNSFLKKSFTFQSEIDTIVQINAFYYYAVYLKTCGNITEEEQTEFQDRMIESYRNFFPRVEKYGPEMLLFKQYPLWKIEK